MEMEPDFIFTEDNAHTITELNLRGDDIIIVQENNPGSPSTYIDIVKMSRQGAIDMAHAILELTTEGNN